MKSDSTVISEKLIISTTGNQTVIIEVFNESILITCCDCLSIREPPSLGSAGTTRIGGHNKILPVTAAGAVKENLEAGGIIFCRSDVP